MINAISTPFAFVLRYLSEWLDSYGWAMIVFALIITAIRIPFDIKGKRGTMKTTLLQPKMKAIQEKYKGDPTKMNQELQKLYKAENAKPMSGCIWMVFPMLIILLLFQIIRQPLTHLMGLDQYQVDALRTALYDLGIRDIGEGGLYQVQMAGYIRPYFAQLHAVVPQIFDINMNFLGLNIGETPDWRAPFSGGTAQEIGLFFLPVISTIAAFVQQKLMTATNYMPQPAQQAQMMKTMMLMMPLMSLFIGFTFPAAMSLYWTASSLTFAIASVFTNMHFKKIFTGMKADMEERDKAREAEIEAKRKKTEELRALGATQENKGTSKKKKQLQEREKERQRQAANRAAGREPEAEEDNPSREGHRKFARGRAYSPERFDGAEDETTPERDLDLDEPDEPTEGEDVLIEDESTSPESEDTLIEDEDMPLLTDGDDDLDSDDYDYDDEDEDHYDEDR